jgi:hypothetical protein
MSDRLPRPELNALQPQAAERASATPIGARTARLVRPQETVAAQRPRTLLELQAWMLDAISGPQERSPDAIVADRPRLSARDRLEIYRYAYSARLTECLRDDYPVLAATLGESRFDAVCREYIALHPSSAPSLNAFGRHMARICATTTTLEAAAPFCAELAALEWALIEVTHAEAPVPLDLNALQAIPADAWSGARLIGSDTLRVLSFSHPVNRHYQTYRGEGVLLPLPAAEVSATAVYRRDLALWRMDLTPAMTRVLQALLAGETIAQALTRIDLRDGDDAALAEAERSVMIWFREWVASGFFAQVVTAASPPTVTASAAR